MVFTELYITPGISLLYFLLSSSATDLEGNDSRLCCSFCGRKRLKLWAFLTFPCSILSEDNNPQDGIHTVCSYPYICFPVYPYQPTPRLGKSGLQISKVILGAMSYGLPSWQGWVLPEEESLPLLKHAYDVGLNTWDTVSISILPFQSLASLMLHPRRTATLMDTLNSSSAKLSSSTRWTAVVSSS